MDSYFISLPKITNNNFDKIFPEFTRIVLQVIDKHTPVKKFSHKQNKFFKKPWIIKAILVFIKKKHALFKTHFLNENNSQKSYYKQYLNKLTKIKANSKNIYFEKELHNNRKSPKNLRYYKDAASLKRKSCKNA